MEFSLPPFLIHVLVIVTGLCLGSFTTALAHRAPQGIAIGLRSSKPRSCCPACGHVLGVRDLVPVFSWLLAGGRCRYCKAPVSKTYPIIEIGVLAACYGVFLAKGLGSECFFLFLAIPALAALLVIDLRYMILPDSLVLYLAVLGAVRLVFLSVFPQGPSVDFNLLLNFIAGGVVMAGIAWGAGILVEKLLAKEALGFGDVKLFGVAGLWVGLTSMGLYFALAGIFGVLLALVFNRAAPGGQFPFGPAMIAALYLILLFS